MNNNILLIISIILVLFYCFIGFEDDTRSYDDAKQNKQEIIRASKCAKLLRDQACRASLRCIDTLDSNVINIPSVRVVKGEALFCVGDFDEAEKEFKDLVKNTSKNDVNNEIAKKYLSKIAHAKRLMRHDIGDYFVELDETAIWENPRNLKVYISNDFNKKQLLYTAFEKWDEGLSDMVNFYYTNDSSEANITAKAIKRETFGVEDRVGETNIKYSYYVNRPEIKYISKADVSVAINFNQDVLLDDEEFYSIALHEIGHALGILSHSPSIGDAMYPSTDSYANARVSNRDVNTVKRLYGNI